MWYGPGQVPTYKAPEAQVLLTFLVSGSFDRYFPLVNIRDRTAQETTREQSMTMRLLKDRRHLHWRGLPNWV
jgi:hypothetical protein